MIRWLLPCLCLGGLDADPPPAPPAPAPILLRPAVEPRPALRYQLLPGRDGLAPGDAAGCYYRALLLLGADRATDDRVYDLVQLPPGEMPRDEARRILDRAASSLREVDLGAGRELCDWGFGGRPEGVDLLLPEIQESRRLARLVDLRARLAIAEGRLDDAWSSIRVGMTLARHVADGPTLVQGIVGIAIARSMTGCLEYLAAAPGAPSLFWALADRPRPLIDLRPAFEFERQIIERELPGLLDLDRGAWSAERARRFADEVQAKLFDFNAGTTPPGFARPIPRRLAPTARRLALAALVAQAEPSVRRALLAAGRPAAEVAALPAIQAAFLHVHDQLRARRDEAFRWANVPYPAAAGRMQLALPPIDDAEANPLLGFFTVLEGGLDPARLAAARLDRQLDAWQVVEAVRLQATRDGGKLPADLAAIRDLPIPPDPVTGRPFGYRVDGDVAVITAPTSPEPTGDPDDALTIRLAPAPASPAPSRRTAP